MTTTAQVKNMVRPLLREHEDLALVGRWIFLKPVHHFARAILIDRMLDAAKFRPRWAVVHLFESRRFFPLSWGELLYNEMSSLPGSWNIADPDVVHSLIRQIETHALPPLRAMRTFDDYLEFVSRHYFRHHLFDWPECRIILEVMLGKLDDARATAKANLEIWSDLRPIRDEEDRERLRQLCELCVSLAADDRTRLVQMLRAWEAQTVKNLKIGHLWEPTPFPLESRLVP
jgi:hypothetical protein